MTLLSAFAPLFTAPSFRTLRGLARNRTALDAGRPAPLEIACQAVAVTWYATAGRVSGDLNARGIRSGAPAMPVRPLAT